MRVVILIASHSDGGKGLPYIEYLNYICTCKLCSVVGYWYILISYILWPWVQSLCVAIFFYMYYKIIIVK